MSARLQKLREVRQHSIAAYQRVSKPQTQAPDMRKAGNAGLSSPHVHWFFLKMHLVGRRYIPVT